MFVFRLDFHYYFLGNIKGHCYLITCLKFRWRMTTCWILFHIIELTEKITHQPLMFEKERKGCWIYHNFHSPLFISKKKDYYCVLPFIYTYVVKHFISLITGNSRKWDRIDAMPASRSRCYCRTWVLLGIIVEAQLY